MKMFFKTVGGRIDAPFIRDKNGFQVPAGVRFDVYDEEDGGVDDFSDGVFLYTAGFPIRTSFKRRMNCRYNAYPDFCIYGTWDGWFLIEKNEPYNGESYGVRFEITEEEARRFEESRGAAAEEIFRSYREKTL